MKQTIESVIKRKTITLELMANAMLLDWSLFSLDAVILVFKLFQ